MLTAYLTTLIIGGSMLLLSILAGGDHEMDQDLQLGTGGLDVDLDAGSDMDLDADADGELALDMYGFDAWLPIASLRFWTFFAAFFGFVGTALSLVGGLGTLMILVPSIGTGYLSGVAATNVLKVLSKKSVGKVIGSSDLIGVSGTLVLPIAPGRPGKIRIEMGGRLLEQIAHSDEESMAIGSGVLIIAMHEDGGVLVTPGPLLETGK